MSKLSIIILNFKKDSMNLTEIEKKLADIFENFNRDEFIYDFLVAYGTSKTSITR